LKILLVAQRFKTHKIEEKPTIIKIGHETQTNIKGNLTLGIYLWFNDKYELKYVKKNY